MTTRRYRLFGDLRSGSAAIEMALAEAAVDYDIVDISLDDDAQHGADYRRINALGKLPSLVTPDGEVLTESAAILLTIAERFPDVRLLPPPEHPDRPVALRWLAYVGAELYPLIEIIDYPERFCPGLDESGEGGADRCDRVRDRVRSIWKSRWRLLDEAVIREGEAGRMLPSGFSLLDIYVAVVSRWAQLDDWRAAHLQNVEALAATVARRPASAPVWARHFGAAGNGSGDSYPDS